MVENQQGLENHIDAVLTFNTKSVSPEIRERMLFGRRELADTLLKNLSKSVKNKNSIQVQIIGKRGMGKSHLLAYLYDRMQSFLKKDKCKIAYLSEEEYGVASYLDILVRIIQSFKRWHPETEEFFETRLDKLREAHQESQESLAEQIVIEYSEGKPMYIFLENLDDIFEAIKVEGQNLLRAFLTRNANVSMFCTSQALSIDVEKEDKPFFGFFETIYLKQLTFEESLDLVKELALIENNEKVTEFLNGKGEGYVAAIHKLVKGNPRLLIRFYEFLKSDTMSNLSVIFMKTINELKPYFESFIRPLPALEQKILYYLAFQRIPKCSADIAKDNFIQKTSLSKKLSELQRRQLIDALGNPQSKRDKLYEIADPMLRMALATGENRNGISGMMLDFMALWYSVSELREQKDKYAENVFEKRFRDMAIERKSQILNIYLDKDEVHNEVEKCIKKNYYLEAEQFLEGIPLNHRNSIYYCAKVNLLNAQKKYQESVNLLIEKLKEYPNDYKYHFYMGVTLTYKERYQEAIISFEKVIELTEPSYHYLLHSLIAYSALFGKIYLKSIQSAIIYSLNENVNIKRFNDYSADLFLTLNKDEDINADSMDNILNYLDEVSEVKESHYLKDFLSIYTDYVFNHKDEVLLNLPKEIREGFIRIKKERVMSSPQ